MGDAILDVGEQTEVSLPAPEMPRHPAAPGAAGRRMRAIDTLLAGVTVSRL